MKGQHNIFIIVSYKVTENGNKNLCGISHHIPFLSAHIELSLSSVYKSQIGRACMLVHVNLCLLPPIGTAALLLIKIARSNRPHGGKAHCNFRKHMKKKNLETFSIRVQRLHLMSRLIQSPFSVATSQQYCPPGKPPSVTDVCIRHRTCLL